MNNLLDVLIFIIAVRFAWKILRFLTKKDKKHRKSIIGKIGLLFSRSLHNRLDKMIVKQKENLIKMETKQDKENIIELKKYKSIKES